MTENARWVQRLDNYNRALVQLLEAVELSNKRQLSRIEEQGLIQAFEFTFELAWSTIKDFYKNQGETGVQGSRDAFRMAFNRGLISDGEAWMDMIQSRVLTSHTYNEATAKKVVDDVLQKYSGMLTGLNTSLNKLAGRT